MQLKLSFTLKRPLSLPLGHHAALQGFIYHLLSESPEYADFLHDIGYMDSAHSFKLFVFSILRGRHSIASNRIIYYDQVTLYVRSPKSEFCNILMTSLQNNPLLELEHQQVELSECAFSQKKIDKESIDIRMLSPLTLSTTYYEGVKKKTLFLTPSDDHFLTALQHNTASKYRAAFGCDPESEVSLSILSLSEDDRYVTKFNNRIYITGWNGTYRLSGDPDVLSFLYDAGLGSRNSQGFGMFETL